MSLVKRTSLKDRESPLDELFRTTAPGEKTTDLLHDKKPEKREVEPVQEALLMLGEDIKRKREQQLEKIRTEEEVFKKKKAKIKEKKKIDLRQTTLILYSYQLEWLDLKRIEARTKRGTPLSNAKLMRAFIDLGISSPIDLSGVKSEEEVIKRLEEGIKKK